MPFPQFYLPKGCYLQSLSAVKRYQFWFIKKANKLIIRAN